MNLYSPTLTPNFDLPWPLRPLCDLLDIFFQLQNIQLNRSINGAPWYMAKTCATGFQNFGCYVAKTTFYFIEEPIVALFMVKWSRALISGQKLTNPSKCPFFYPWNLTKYPKSCSQMLRGQIKPSKLIFWDRTKVDTDSETLKDSNMCSRSKFFGLNDFFLVKNWKEADLLKIKEKLGANLSKNASFQSHVEYLFGHLSTRG